jgi:hypothetical protein
MQDPEPDKPVSWVPHRSVYGGAIVGTFVAQLIIAGIEFYLHATASTTVHDAITGLCIFGACYFIPDRPN